METKWSFHCQIPVNLFDIMVPESGDILIPTAVGGSLMINSTGLYSYWGPEENFDDNVSDVFTYKFANAELELSAAGQFVIEIKDTMPTAYDNANFVVPHVEQFLSSFNNFSGWNASGHEHIVYNAGSLRGLLSTRNVHESVTSENTLAVLLGLSSSALDDVQGYNAVEGSAIWRTVQLEAGMEIKFDYRFATNDPFETDDDDFAFISLSGNGEQSVVNFADTNDVIFGANIFEDSTFWDRNTGWQDGSFIVPDGWVSGNYVLGFGVMDVGSPNQTYGDSSMVMIDNVELLAPPNLVTGNVIIDGNEDFFSSDPVGIIDEVLGDGGFVSEIAFDVGGSANAYISANGLGALGASGDGSIVTIPVPPGGVEFDTVEGGHLRMEQNGEYEYSSPSSPDENSETFLYTLSEQDGVDSSTANLTVYFAQDKPPEDAGSEEFESYHIDFDDDSGVYNIASLEAGDMLDFESVPDVDAPFGGLAQPDFEDVVNSWVQQGDHVVAQLENNGILVLQGIGVVSGSMNSDLEQHLQDMMVNVNISGVI